MKDYICECTNCGATLTDENPQVDAKKHKLTGEELVMVINMDKNHEAYMCWVCPNCKTDSYLTDK